MAIGRRRRPGDSSLLFFGFDRFGLAAAARLRSSTAQNARQPSGPGCFAGEAPGTDFSGVPGSGIEAGVRKYSGGVSGPQVGVRHYLEKIFR
jgi:hypothetical protein